MKKIFFMLFLSFAILNAHATEEDNLTRFTQNAKRAGRPLEQTSCPRSGEFFTTAWEFEGRVVSSPHTCDEHCDPLMRDINFDRKFLKRLRGHEDDFDLGRLAPPELDLRALALQMARDNFETPNEVLLQNLTPEDLFPELNLLISSLENPQASEFQIPGLEAPLDLPLVTVPALALDVSLPPLDLVHVPEDVSYDRAAAE